MDIEISAGGWCPEIDLTANGVTTVVFVDEDLSSIEVVVVDNTAPVRWTCDGSDPGEDAGWYVPKDGVDQRAVSHAANDEGPYSTVVKLWTSGTAKACVQRGDSSAA